MDDLTRFEERFSERVRAFGRTGVVTVDSAAVAHAAAASHPRSAGAGILSRRLGLSVDRRAWSIAIALGLLALALGSALIGARLLTPPPLDASLPANGWIAFTGWMADPAGVEPESDLWFTSLGGEPRRVVGDDTDDVDEQCPAFSPDGRSLVYGRVEGHGNVVNEDGQEVAGSATYRNAAIVVADVSDDGQVTDRLTVEVEDGLDAPCPVWSPDGSRLAYGVNRATENDPEMTAAGSEVRVVDLPDGRVTVLPDLLATDLEWSPDGSTLAIASGKEENLCCWALGDGRIHLYSPSSGGMRTLDATLGALQFAWSPDGRRIAYEAFPRRGGEERHEISVIDIDTGQQRKLAGPHYAAGMGPVWSPDGGTIAYQRGVGGDEHSDIVLLTAGDPSDESASPRAVLVQVNTLLPSEILSPFGRLSPSQTTWSPDGRYLLMEAWGNGTPDTPVDTRALPGGPRTDGGSKFLVMIPVDPATPPVVVARMGGLGDGTWGPAPRD